MPIEDELLFSLLDELGGTILDESTPVPTVLIWSGKLIGPNCNSV